MQPLKNKHLLTKDMDAFQISYAILKMSQQEVTKLMRVLMHTVKLFYRYQENLFQTHSVI